MSAHSPAPWEMHPAPYGWDIWANTPEKFRQWVTPVTRLASPHKAIFDGSIEVDAATCEANARIMAAAPEMLAALHRASHYLDKRDPAYDDVMAAIAKAEGPPCPPSAN